MSTPDTIGFAILGTGMVSDYHRKAIEANADSGSRLVAVGHHDPARFEEIGARFGVPCYGIDELLARPEVDAVCICTPSGQHAGQAIAAAKAGKHVLVEKPMAIRLADADEMISVCEKTGVQLGVVLQRRAEPLWRRIREAIVSGGLGEPTLASITIPYHRPQSYYDRARWRGTWALDGGGVLMNQGIHLVDLLVWYMGDPVEVRAHAGTLHQNIEAEDTISAALRFADGAMATITATSTAAPGFPHRVEIYGTGGGIQVEGESARRWEMVEPERATVDPLLPKDSEGEEAGAGGDPGGITPTGHIAILKDFVHAAQTERSLQLDGAEGRRSLAAVLKVYEAAGLPYLATNESVWGR